ncbi:MAG: AbrB/MazE/SpoVT family DNA-binding domain-containing protein [Acidobacteria bacterium]|nr:AbrB/MazE/SpoVT family DNA-binding domain-containing protein [Acidobacteriota bacterium]
MKAATRVTSRGQVVIPKLVRKQLRWMSGTQLAVEVMGDGAVRLMPLETEDPIDMLYGCLKDLPQDPLADLEAEHQAEIEADERRQRRGRWPRQVCGH